MYTVRFSFTKPKAKKPYLEYDDHEPSLVAANVMISAVVRLYTSRGNVVKWAITDDEGKTVAKSEEEEETKQIGEDATGNTQSGEG